MPQPQRPSRNKKFGLSTAWSCGPRTSQWDLFWTRLLAYAMEHLALPDEMNGSLRAPSDSEPSATSDDSRRPDDDRRDR